MHMTYDIPYTEDEREEIVIDIARATILLLSLQELREALHTLIATRG